MPNGRPGDHPVRDILMHEMQIYSERTRELVEETDALDGRKALYDTSWPPYFTDDPIEEEVEALERQLEQIRDEIRDSD